MTQINIVQMLDIKSPELVGLTYDGKTLWVCVDGICRLRISHLLVENFIVDIQQEQESK